MKTINSIKNHTVKLNGQRWRVASGHFESLSAFGDYLADIDKTGLVDGKLRNKRELSYQGEASDWTGNHSLKDTIKVLQSGGYWPEGTEKLQAIKINPDAIDSLKEVIKRVFIRSVAGGGVSVGEYLSGAPDCMRRPFKQPKLTKVVTIETSAFLSGGIENSSLLNVGRAILAVIDVLESHGFSVELNHRLCVTKDVQNALDVTIALKRAGEAWSPSSVAYALTHAAMFRQATFRLVDAFKNTYRLNTSMGHPQCIGDFIGETNKTADLALPPLAYSREEQDYATPEKALRFIMRELKKQNPELLAA